MRGGEQKQGYTIIEVMIFLAISGVMFIIAASFVSGKQAKSEFRQGMNSINTQIQQTINDVSNGFYPSSSNFTCSASAAQGTPITFNTGQAEDESTNPGGCTFMGKVMQFDVGTTSSSSYNIYSIIGRQYQTDNKSLIPPASFNDAQPVAATGNSGTPNLTDTNSFEWGLTVDKMYDKDQAHPIGAFGIFAGFASSDSNKLASGAAAPMVIAIPGSQLGQTSTSIDTQIASLSDPHTVIDYAPNIILCFKGDASQYGTLTLGSSDSVQSQKLTTHIQITSGSPTPECT